MANTYTDLLRMRKPALGDIGWDDEVNDNTDISEFVFGSVLKSNVVISGLVPSIGSGLDMDVTAGEAIVAGASQAVAADSLTCTANAVNWLYVDSSGDLQLTTTAPVGDYAAIAIVDAGTSTITRYGDVRNHAEGALTIDVSHTPDNYTVDTSKTGAINQHLSGIDNQIGFMAGFKNKIINPSFLFWTRGTSQSNSGYGSADRWYVNLSGATGTLSKQAFTLGQTDVPGHPEYYGRLDITVGNDYAGIFQYMEGVETFAGETVTISFWAKANKIINLRVQGKQKFGTGGTPSPDTYISADVSLSTTWEFYTVTFNVGGLIGKQKGTNNNDYFAVQFVNPISETFILDMAQVQVEAGNEATSFEVRPDEIEQALCERFCFKYASNRLISTAFLSVIYTQIPLLTTMRGTPTVYSWITKLALTGGSWKVPTSCTVSGAWPHALGVQMSGNLGTLITNDSYLTDLEVIIEAELT